MSCDLKVFRVGGRRGDLAAAPERLGKLACRFSATATPRVGPAIGLIAGEPSSWRRPKCRQVRRRCRWTPRAVLPAYGTYDVVEPHGRGSAGNLVGQVTHDKYSPARPGVEETGQTAAPSDCAQLLHLACAAMPYPAVLFPGSARAAPTTRSPPSGSATTPGPIRPCSPVGQRQRVAVVRGAGRGDGEPSHRPGGSGRAPGSPPAGPVVRRKGVSRLPARSWRGVTETSTPPHPIGRNSWPRKRRSECSRSGEPSTCCI
jgi:hypothetical protein